jgi:hypothetical protein
MHSASANQDATVHEVPGRDFKTGRQETGTISHFLQPFFLFPILKKKESS